MTKRREFLPYFAIVARRLIGSVDSVCGRHRQTLPALRESESGMGDKAIMATVWLDGCSGCRMSFLDIDERLIELADLMTLAYSPLVDTKDFPEMADVTLVEGAVSSRMIWRKYAKCARIRRPGFAG